MNMLAVSRAVNQTVNASASRKGSSAVFRTLSLQMTKTETVRTPGRIEVDNLLLVLRSSLPTSREIRDYELIIVDHHRGHDGSSMTNRTPAGIIIVIRGEKRRIAWINWLSHLFCSVLYSKDMYTMERDIFAKVRRIFSRERLIFSSVNHINAANDW